MTRHVKRRVASVAGIVRRSRVLSLDEAWAGRLGIDSTDRAERADRLEQELQARFEHLSGFLLGGEMPPAGTLSTDAEDKFAVAYGDLSVLAGFLADAQRLMAGQEGVR